jgi:putative holliday junction resolvase
MRVMAVDPGERYLGIAISDEGGMLSRPLTTLKHVSRDVDAAKIAALAAEQTVRLIVIGFALDSDGRLGPQARHSEKLANAVRGHTALPVVLHDESFSSQDAEATLRALGKNRQARRDQIHAAAAASILQSYLDGHPPEAPAGQ